jgi:hypothetical protein
LARCYACSEVAVANEHGARAVFGEDRPVAASADIERFPNVVMAPVTMSVMMTMMMTMMSVTMATMLATVSAAGGRRSDRSCGQSESRDGSEGNLTKHSCSPFQA